VRCRLRSAFPVGASLSGGLDSSSIACTAQYLLAEAAKTRLHTFSAIFPNLPKEDMAKIDERRYMQAVLDRGGFEPHFIEADRIGPLTDLEKILWHEDEAILAPNLYIHWALYRSAQDAGCRIFLDGFDGDTTVSHGLEYLGHLARRGRWLKLYSEASELSKKSPNPSFTGRRIFWRYGIRRAIPQPAVRLWRTIRGQFQPGSDSEFNPAFARRMRLDEKARFLEKNSESHTGRVREGHYRSLVSGQIPYTLELADKASAAFGLEGRYPFFDRRLMEFCLALPPEQKLNQGWTRAILRRATSGILPSEVQWRIGKANLSPNFKRRLLDYGKPVLDDLIENNLPVGDYFDMASLGAAYERYKAQPARRESEALTLYSAVMLGSWLKRAGHKNHSSCGLPNRQEKIGAIRI